MAPAQRIVIVGGNLAGGAAATTLRGEGFDGPLTIIGAEPWPPYERPPLSKGYVRGEEPRDKAFLHPDQWYADHDVELMLGTRATRVDTEERVVEVEGGGRVPFDKLLIATGGRNRKVRADGADLEGVHELRTIEDADRIREEAVAGRKAAIVGAGFIGSEVSASLRARGVEVEVVEFGPAPLVRVLGPDISRVYEGIHRDHGVRFHFGEGVASFEGNGRVEALITDKGTRIDCDFAVVGVGIEPVTEVIEGTSIEVDNGVVVDEYCRTNVEGIFAAGDVANHFHPVFGRRLRVEHWDNALKQGAVAALNMLGRDEAFDDPHWFWSDQYEHNLQYVGHAIAWDDLVIRGSLEERDFVAFYVNQGMIDGVVGLDRGKQVRRAAALVKARTPVEPAVLRDEDVDLKKLGAELLGGRR
ncbi:MAG TPA: FAD-dependent oxidoreductase [Actinomycetota bacterium]|nr:FAD-dependent oxidoreductase [Actinomycetota bacterium]